MIRLLTPAALTLAAAGPALAASGPFFSLRNTDFVVLLGFLVAIALVIYLKVPAKLTGMLDERADGIRRDLDEARSIREEAAALLTSYERRTREAREQADEIVANAKREAEAAATRARADLETSVERRMASAEDQIDSARDAAVREVRDQAILVATAVAGEVVAKQMSASEANAMIDRSIETVRAKLH